MDQLTELEQILADHHIEYVKNESLCQHCSFRIGGPADLMIRPRTSKETETVLAAAEAHGVRLLVLGKGSNMLFADEGYRGAVLQMGPGFGAMELVDDTTIRCDSGASLMGLCVFAWEKGLSGLEFAYGIPGSVGGAVYMNAGAYGGEIGDVLVSASHICPHGGPGVLRGEDLALSYRHSAYSDSDKIITGGVFRLKKDDKAAIRGRMDDYMGRRREKQPLELPSAGSTFKRPQGAYASALVDQCGLKGLRVGGAMVSEKHAGFVVNAGGATSADVQALIRKVQQEVKRQTGFDLAPEVRIIPA